ncbi:metallophosphoesterase [Pseudoruegeria sp. SK021]|uniref:metallophosphoesterase n=1 Tax=Pseudoruegeria sp. SK021 TaxID=1933035 RepID=UPI000A237968|nr:metallophosphoesterase [Pseudoruegeria sp. SK021]OSP55381.1 hypothetical protein BV911_08075 [Pseudoruegeria sp. SK021]
MKASTALASRPAWAPIGPPNPAKGIFGLWGAPQLTLHRLAHPRWDGPALRIAVIADPHVCLPWMTPDRMRAIVDQVMTLDADIILLAGDFLADSKMPCKHLPASLIAPLFAPLDAPLGVHGILGNHDWKDCPRARATNHAENSVIDAFIASGRPLKGNEATALRHGDQDFWLVTMDSQMSNGRKYPGHENPEAAFANVPDGAPCILLAHEPDYFAKGDTRPMLQISGHTHGGQFTIFGRRPMTPSNYGDRYALGHVTDGARHLFVSAGLGYSGLPLRFWVPPEVMLIELTAET